MVGVLDVFAILFGSFCELVAVIVFFSELALGKSRVGELFVELDELGDSEVRVYLVVEVGILDIGFGVDVACFFVIDHSLFVAAGCGTYVSGLEHVALENVDLSFLVFGNFHCLVDLLVDFLGVESGVYIKICAGHGCHERGVFLVGLKSFLEEVRGF